MKKEFPWENFINKLLIAWGILCITGLEIYALSKGINGILLTTSIAVIAAAIGYIAPHKKNSTK